MVLSYWYASNTPKIIDLFSFKSAVCQLVALCLFTIVLYYDGNY